MAGKDSRNEVLALQTSATEIRIIANKNGHSKLWKYFCFLATGSGDGETFDKKAVCRLCKVVSPYSGNTTNFATHLEHHHPVEYSAFLEESGPLPNISIYCYYGVHNNRYVKFQYRPALT